MGFEERDESYYAFKPITNPIVLDFTGIRYLGEVHLLLKKQFGLPEYYGQNWDALWDCLDGFFIGMGPFTVEIRGFATMPEDIQEECEKMLKVFHDVRKDTPNVEFLMIS